MTVMIHNYSKHNKHRITASAHAKLIFSQTTFTLFNWGKKTLKEHSSVSQSGKKDPEIYPEILSGKKGTGSRQHTKWYEDAYGVKTGDISFKALTY